MLRFLSIRTLASSTTVRLLTFHAPFTLRIESLDRSAFAATGCDDLGVMDGRLFVERQHPPREVVRKHWLGRRGERRAPFPKERSCRG
jgi:hypothetical protein